MMDIAEIERRRQLSIKAIKVREREAWLARYQAKCDREYWTRGQCCAGCDHWASDGGMTGTCDANGMVSGADVMRSIGAMWSTYTPPPGFPYTASDFHCGKFKDDFDWSTLDASYLQQIGAMRDGQLRPKPTKTAR
jgi:hypothetical protein